MLNAASKVARSLSKKDTFPTFPESFGADDTDSHRLQGSSRSLGSTAGSNRSGPGGKSRTKSPNPSKVKTLDPTTTTWATSREHSLFGGLLSEDGEKLAKIDDTEQEAREYAHHNIWYIFFASTYASLKVFAAYLITLNSIFGVLLTIGSTLVVYFTTEADAVYLGTMDWVLLGFAVVLPLSAIVRFAFVRRDQSLRYIMEMKSNALHIYLAHATWDWCDGKGRASSGKDWLKHSDRVLEELINIADEFCRYLTMPTSSQARHREMKGGRKEAASTMKAMYLLFDSITSTRITRLTILAENLKTAGLSPTEASRIRQWERFMVRSMEEIRAIKTYRTPLALRAFANIFTLLIPPFYAPSFVQIAYDMNSLAMGIAFAIITSLALTALYESVNNLEDPFVANLTLDGINVHEELSVLFWMTLTNARSVAFPKAPPLEMSEDSDETRKENAVNRASLRASFAQSKAHSKGLLSIRNLVMEGLSADKKHDALRPTERAGRVSQFDVDYFTRNDPMRSSFHPPDRMKDRMNSSGHRRFRESLSLGGINGSRRPSDVGTSSANEDSGDPNETSG